MTELLLIGVLGGGLLWMIAATMYMSLWTFTKCRYPQREDLVWLALGMVFWPVAIFLLEGENCVEED